MYDAAHLSGGVDPSGAITFTLFGPDAPRRPLKKSGVCPVG